MGHAARYMKGRVKTKVSPTMVVNPDHVSPTVLSDIERDFYQNLEPRVFINIADATGPEKAILDTLRAYWEVVTIGKVGVDQFYDNGYRGLFADETYIDNKESKISQLVDGNKLYDTRTVKISVRECSVSDNIAVLISNYTWNYFSLDAEHLLREDGLCFQTWSKRGKDWKIQYEYIEQGWTEIEN